MRVVIDTNVLVSAVLKPASIPASILALIVDGGIVPLYDERILHEYRNVLVRPKFKFSPSLCDAFISLIRLNGESVIVRSADWAGTDVDDKMFWEVMLSGNADYLISGNTRHFPADNRVVVPSGFMRIFEKEKQVT